MAPRPAGRCARAGRAPRRVDERREIGSGEIPGEGGKGDGGGAPLPPHLLLLLLVHPLKRETRVEPQALFIHLSFLFRLHPPNVFSGHGNVTSHQAFPDCYLTVGQMAGQMAPTHTGMYERRNSLRICKLYPGFHHQSRDADGRGGERQAHPRFQVVAQPLRRACLCHPAASTTPAAKSSVTAAARLSIPSEEAEAARNAVPADRSPPGGAASRTTTAPSSCR